MNRRQCLDAAASAVLGQREQDYGTPESNFGCIADFWSNYLNQQIEAHDVAIMMALLKIARLKTNPKHADSFIDLAGYAACGAEVATEKTPDAAKSCETCKWDRNGFCDSDRICDDMDRWEPRN